MPVKCTFHWLAHSTELGNSYTGFLPIPRFCTYHIHGPSVGHLSLSLSLIYVILHVLLCRIKICNIFPSPRDCSDKSVAKTMKAEKCACFLEQACPRKCALPRVFGLPDTLHLKRVLTKSVDVHSFMSTEILCGEKKSLGDNRRQCVVHPSH